MLQKIDYFEKRQKQIETGMSTIMDHGYLLAYVQTVVPTLGCKSWAHIPVAYPHSNNNHNHNKNHNNQNN